MLTDIMDFEPRITSDGDAYGVNCNFHFGYVHDDLYEDAKNEEACVQALRHLIAKADAEIEDLEDEFALLQCQRKWAESDEHKNPFEVCCAVFQRKIDSLTSSIQRVNDGVDTLSEIQRPAERIYDIVDALIKSNFEEPEQLQEGDLRNEKNQAVSTGSLDIDADEGQQAPTLELNMESEKQTPILGKLDKPTQNISEESSSDAARDMSKELMEVISMGSSNIEVSEKVDIAGHASELIGGLLTSTETITSQSSLQASNDEGNSKLTAPQHGDTENSTGVLKAGGGSSSNLVAKTQEIVKALRDGRDTSIQNISAVSVQNHEGKGSVEVHLKAQENLTLSVSDLERRESGLSTIFKPLGQNVQSKNLDAVVPFSPDLKKLNPLITNMKRKYSSIELNFGQSGSPSEIQGSAEDAACEIPHQVPLAITHQPRKAESDFAGHEVTVVVGLEASSLAEVKDSLTPRNNILLAGCSRPTVSPIVDLQDVKNKLSGDPKYLSKLRLPDLKQIARLYNVRRFSKLKKEELIQELLKCLATSQ